VIDLKPDIKENDINKKRKKDCQPNRIEEKENIKIYKSKKIKNNQTEYRKSKAYLKRKKEKRKKKRLLKKEKILLENKIFNSSLKGDIKIISNKYYNYNNNNIDFLKNKMIDFFQRNKSTDNKFYSAMSIIKNNNFVYKRWKIKKVLKKYLKSTTLWEFERSLKLSR